MRLFFQVTGVLVIVFAAGLLRAGRAVPPGRRRPRDAEQRRLRPTGLALAHRSTPRRAGSWRGSSAGTPGRALEQVARLRCSTSCRCWSCSSGTARRAAPAGTPPAAGGAPPAAASARRDRRTRPSGGRPSGHSGHPVTGGSRNARRRAGRAMPWAARAVRQPRAQSTRQARPRTPSCTSSSTRSTTAVDPPQPEHLQRDPSPTAGRPSVERLPDQADREEDQDEADERTTCRPA